MRKAREKDDNGIYYICQYSGNERKLFNDDNDRARLLNIILQVQEKFLFKLYAYCLVKDESYHLILGLNGADISQIMKSINIAYAMYIKCTGNIFKDRYKSRLLNDTDIENTIKEIMAENHADEKCRFMNMKPIELKSDDLCRECIHTLEQAQNKLNSIDPDLLKDIEKRNEIIRDFRKQSTLSLKELGILFNLTESSVCKILKSEQEK